MANVKQPSPVKIALSAIPRDHPRYQDIRAAVVRGFVIRRKAARVIGKGAALVSGAFAFGVRGIAVFVLMSIAHGAAAAAARIAAVQK